MEMLPVQAPKSKDLLAALELLMRIYLGSSQNPRVYESRMEALKACIRFPEQSLSNKRLIEIRRLSQHLSSKYREFLLTNAFERAIRNLWNFPKDIYGYILGHLSIRDGENLIKFNPVFRKLIDFFYFKQIESHSIRIVCLLVSHQLFGLARESFGEEDNLDFEGKWKKADDEAKEICKAVLEKKRNYQYNFNVRYYRSVHWPDFFEFYNFRPAYYNAVNGDGLFCRTLYSKIKDRLRYSWEGHAYLPMFPNGKAVKIPLVLRGQDFPGVALDKVDDANMKTIVFSLWVAIPTYVPVEDVRLAFEELKKYLDPYICGKDFYKIANNFVIRLLDFICCYENHIALNFFCFEPNFKFLIMAIKNNQIELLRKWISCGLELDEALFEVSKFGSCEVVNLFLEAGASINVTNVNGETPLVVAFLHRKYDVVFSQFLISKGSNPFYLLQFLGNAEKNPEAKIITKRVYECFTNLPPSTLQSLSLYSVFTVTENAFFLYAMFSWGKYELVDVMINHCSESDDFKKYSCAVLQTAYRYSDTRFLDYIIDRGINALDILDSMPTLEPKSDGLKKVFIKRMLRRHIEDNPTDDRAKNLLGMIIGTQKALGLNDRFLIGLIYCHIKNNPNDEKAKNLFAVFTGTRKISLDLGDRFLIGVRGFFGGAAGKVIDKIYTLAKPFLEPEGEKKSEVVDAHAEKALGAGKFNAGFLRR